METGSERLGYNEPSQASGPLEVMASPEAIVPGESRMRYKVVLDRSEEGVAASVPGLPGCWSQGETEAEALENIRVAITEYLEAVNELTRDVEVREVEVAV